MLFVQHAIHFLALKCGYVTCRGIEEYISVHGLRLCTPSYFRHKLSLSVHQFYLNPFWRLGKSGAVIFPVIL